MRAHRRSSRRSLILAVLGFLIISTYLFVGLAPGSLNRRLSDQLQRLTGKEVRFSKLLWLPFEGFSLHGVRIAERAGRPLLTADKISVNVRLLPFLRDKKIVLSAVTLERPVMDWALHRPEPPREAPRPMTRLSGQIEVPVASDQKKIDLSSIEEGPNFFLPENVYLEGIRVSNGTLTLRADPASDAFEELGAIHLRLAFARPPVLTFDGSFKLLTDRSALIKAKGAWDLETARYRLAAEAKGDHLPPWLVRYQKDHFIQLSKAAYALSATIARADDDRALFDVKADLRDAMLSANHAAYEGRMLLKAQGLFNFESRRFERYKGALELVKIDIRNLTREIDRLSGISAVAQFEPDLLRIDNARGRYKELDFTAKLVIRSFKELLMKAEIGTDMDMADILALIPAEQKIWLKGFELGGKCQAITEISGSLRKASHLVKDYNLVLRDGIVRNTAKKIDATGVFAKVSSREDGLRVSDARFFVNDRLYTLSLYLPKDRTENGRLRFGAADTDLDADFRLAGEGLSVLRAKAAAYGVEASFAGHVSSLADPVLDIRGHLELSLPELERVLKKNVKGYPGYDLRGALSGAFTLSGRPTDLMNADLRVDARGGSLRVGKSFALDRPELQLRSHRGKLAFPYLRGELYGGAFSGDAVVDLAQADPAFLAKFIIDRADLSRWAADLPKADRRLSGLLALQGDITGRFKHADSLEGTLALEIKDGWLFESKEFRQMGQLPLFIKVEGLDNVAFRQARGNFTVRDRKLWTDNLNLIGDTVDLMLRGSIRFDQELDMLMEIRYSNDVLRGAYETGGIVPFVIQNAEGMISEYQVTGTVGKPVYTKVSVPKSVGRKLGGALKSLTG